MSEQKPEKMSAGNAIKKYTGCTFDEVKDLRQTCPNEEWEELGKQACAALGVEYVAAAKPQA